MFEWFNISNVYQKNQPDIGTSLSLKPLTGCDVGSFHDAVSSWTKNIERRIVDDWWVGMVLEGRRRGLIEALPQLDGLTNHENLGQVSR
jgi:hypothetical protein